MIKIVDKSNQKIVILNYKKCTVSIMKIYPPSIFKRVLYMILFDNKTKIKWEYNKRVLYMILFENKTKIKWKYNNSIVSEIETLH
jgi:hypothetical protein